MKNIVKKNLPGMNPKAGADEVGVTMVVTPNYESTYSVTLSDIANTFYGRGGKQLSFAARH